MYEVITDSSPYPELESGEMSDLDFRNKVVNENYRPKFFMHMNENLKHLIEQCWSENPNERPSFDEIFDRLTNFDDEDDDKKLNYLLEDVDMNELNVYIEDISVITDLTEQLLSKIDTIDKENQKLKNKISKMENVEKLHSIENENQKLKENINLLETENKEQLNKNISIENENQKLKKDIKDLKSKNKKQINGKSFIHPPLFESELLNYLIEYIEGNI